MPFSPTPEQQAIIDFAASSKQNLMVNALAGAAKTSTLVMIAEALPSEQFLTLAFNKRIQVEMAERLPSNCTALTLNSAGHRAWGSFLRKRLVLKKNKMFDILSSWIDNHQYEIDEAFYADEYDDVLRTLRAMKSTGWIPDRYKHPQFKPKRLLDDEEFFEGFLDFEPTERQVECLTWCMLESIRQAWDAIIDYDDQIMMSALFPASFPQYPNTMVDEAQDLSVLNHLMLTKMVGLGRLFAVGDPYQAIYAFRGAHENSMSLLRDRFKMHELGLSISFRCPRAVMEEARSRAAHMQYPEWAAQGSVKVLPHWSTSDLPENAAIICRNNAPIFNLAVKLISAGRHVEVIGSDMSKRLIKILEKLGAPEMPQEELLSAIDLWAQKELAKKRKKERVEDMRQCLESFALNSATLDEAIKYVERIFSSQGPLKLMTGHKSKGLEFHDVYLLDRHLLRTGPEDDGQDKNLLYVMQTRAMSNLTYVDTEGYRG